VQKEPGGIVLILGSAPNVLACRDWPRAPVDRIVAINNAWRVSPDWDFMIHPEDFPADRGPDQLAPNQRIVTATDYVPHQNALGGFVYAGGTMAFTAGYWVLSALRPRVIAFFGCDMVYPGQTNTHFYGTGAADPLRADVTLRDLSAKSARLMLLAAEQGCACVNLSRRDSRLVFPRSDHSRLAAVNPVTVNRSACDAARAEEARLGYFVESGRYWEVKDRFDPARLDRIDALWLSAHDRSTRVELAG